MSRSQPRLLVAPLDRDDRPTPQNLFDELNAEFGFSIDVCAQAHNTKCDRFFSPEDDGLSRSWAGEVCWCNPPYSEIPRWTQKAIDESQKGAVVVMLLPVSTDTKWFHDTVLDRCEIRWLKGRIKFEGQKFTAPFASMLAVYRSTRGGSK